MKILNARSCQKQDLKIYQWCIQTSLAWASFLTAVPQLNSSMASLFCLNKSAWVFTKGLICLGKKSAETHDMAAILLSGVRRAAACRYGQVTLACWLVQPAAKRDRVPAFLWTTGLLGHG